MVWQRRRTSAGTSHRGHVFSLLATILLGPLAWAFVPSAHKCMIPASRLQMVLSPPPESSSNSRSKKLKRQRAVLQTGVEGGKIGTTRRRKRRKYNRKREKPITEKQNDQLKKKRQAAYEQIRSNGGRAAPPSIWGFESLFPAPVWDEEVVQRDLYEITQRDKPVATKQAEFKELMKEQNLEPEQVAWGFESLFPEPVVDEETVQRDLYEISKRDAELADKQAKSTEPTVKEGTSEEEESTRKQNLDPEQVAQKSASKTVVSELLAPTIEPARVDSGKKETFNRDFSTTKKRGIKRAPPRKSTVCVDTLSRKVEESVYGYRDTQAGSFYDTSLVREGAVQFRDGVRLGRALSVNADRLNYHAKNNLKHERVEEAQELYEMAIEMDPRDGRAYLGLSRIAQKRRDFKRAKQWLRVGIANAVGSSSSDDVSSDVGANPFLLQALGCLEERIGNLMEAEANYIAAVKSRPSHAAAWVSLAQLRTRKLRQGAAAGRICFQTAERELKRAGRKPSSYVYTAWAALEYKKAGDVRRARELFQAAIDVDPKCSAAWLQLGVLESDKENWKEAQKCFETVLKFDQRNSRVLQAFAIMETKRPDGDSRKAIDLFERALKVNTRDAGVLQPYALYVAKLGDIDAARDLLRQGTEVNKRHAPVWQAWGVLETRYGTAQKARDIFQQGIWACAQLAGGQSGGYRCARLWQAWGVLEAQERSYAAARRCFNRALDADNRNVATINAWTLMEADLGNYADARHIFERALKQFPSSSDEKLSVWRAYEVMEQRAGDVDAAQQVYQRYMRETFEVQDEKLVAANNMDIQTTPKETEQTMKEVLKKTKDFEVVRWDVASSLPGEVWMNKGSIEGKVPTSTMKKKKSNPKTNLSDNTNSNSP